MKQEAMAGPVRRHTMLAAFALVLAFMAPGTALAQPLPAYTAKAGAMPIGKDGAKPDAEIFHVAYTAKGADPATRPVTFVFNGGPGGSSAYLHLAALGPKTLKTAGDGKFPPSPARLAENPDSWIAFTDLVFVDPVGTGYSRMLPGPDGKPGDPKAYYDVESDVHSLAHFMQKWLTAHQRWSSPKAIAGESYAGRRMAGLLSVLPRTYNINLNRVVFISPEFSVPSLVEPFPVYDLFHAMVLLPTQAAVAAFHGKSTIKNDAAGYKTAEDFATGEYLTGLARLGRMGEKEQAAFYAKIGGLIGIDPAVVAVNRGRVGEAVYLNALFAKQGKVLDLYDGTQATDNPKPEQRDALAALPRSLDVLGGILLPPFMDYARTELGLAADRPYVVLNIEASMLWNRKSPMGTPEDVAVALAQNTDLKALVVHGYQDMGANYFLSRYLLEQVVHAPSSRGRLAFRTYQGGHMFYLRSKSRAELFADVKAFFKAP